MVRYSPKRPSSLLVRNWASGRLVPCAEERSFREWATNEWVLFEDTLCVSYSRHCRSRNKSPKCIASCSSFVWETTEALCFSFDSVVLLWNKIFVFLEEVRCWNFIFSSSRQQCGYEFVSVEKARVHWDNWMNTTDVNLGMRSNRSVAAKARFVVLCRESEQFEKTTLMSCGC